MLKEINNLEVDAINNIVVLFPKTERSAFLARYTNNYIMTSYFIEKFKPYITPEIFSQASGLTIDLVNIYSSLFNKEAYEEHPGNINILYSANIISKYDINLDKVFTQYKTIDIKLTEYLLNLGTGYTKAIINASQIAFLERPDIIQQYGKFYSITSILKLNNISPKYLKILCSEKTFKPEELGRIIFHTLKPETDYDYYQIFDSIQLDESDFEGTVLAKMIIDMKTAFYFIKLPQVFCDTLNKKLTKNSLNQIINNLDLLYPMEDETMSELKEILTQENLVNSTPVKIAKVMPIISKDMKDEDYLW